MGRRVGGILLAVATTGALLATGSGSAQAQLTEVQLRATADRYLFQTPLDEFMRIRASRPFDDQLDWSSDGCTLAPNRPLGFDFTASCVRHDFGYGNYRRQGRFTEDNRRRIDDQFRSDMDTQCGGNRTCLVTADLYYLGVREFGASGLPIAQLLHKPEVRSADG